MAASGMSGMLFSPVSVKTKTQQLIISGVRGVFAMLTLHLLVYRRDIKLV